MYSTNEPFEFEIKKIYIIYDVKIKMKSLAICIGSVCAKLQIIHEKSYEVNINEYILVLIK